MIVCLCVVSLLESMTRENTMTIDEAEASIYDEEISYCQGLSFLAASLVLHVRER